MKTQEFLLFKTAFCIWISYFKEYGIPYKAACEKIDSILLDPDSEKDVEQLFAEANADQEYRKSLKWFMGNYKKDDSTIGKLSKLNDHYLSMMLIIGNELSLVQKHDGVKDILKTTADFFQWIQMQGLEDCMNIDNQITLDYFKNLHQSNSYMNKVIPNMRKVFRILADNGYSNVPDTLLGYKAAPRRNVILPAFTDEEIDRILAVPDRSTFNGFKDFSILVLISMTGLRPVDIRHLRLTNLDFRTETINIVQEKTNVPLKLPMDSILSKTLSIYVKEAHRLIHLNDNDFVFCSATDNRSIMSSRELYLMFQRCMDIAGIDSTTDNRKGLYTFRRTMGKWLLGSGAHPEMIASVLGHQNLNSFKHYVGLSSELLKCVALDFRWMKGGLT